LPHRLQLLAMTGPVASSHTVIASKAKQSQKIVNSPGIAVMLLFGKPAVVI